MSREGRLDEADAGQVVPGPIILTIESHHFKLSNTANHMIGQDASQKFDESDRRKDVRL